MAMWQLVAIFTGRGMQTDFKLYKVDMEYIRNLEIARAGKSQPLPHL